MSVGTKGQELHHAHGGVGGIDGEYHERRTIGVPAHGAGPIAQGPATGTAPLRQGIGPSRVTAPMAPIHRAGARTSRHLAGGGRPHR